MPAARIEQSLGNAEAGNKITAPKAAVIDSAD
jgi:hypothetical protein